VAFLLVKLVRILRDKMVSIRMGRGPMWQAWMTGILGLWLIVASFTLSGNIMNQLIVGVAIAVLGFWTAARI